MIHTLLLLEDEQSKELASALWAALLETEQFYNHDHKRTEMRRHFVSPFAPSLGPLDNARRAMGRLVRGPHAADALERLSQSERRKQSIADVRTAGRFAGTYDQLKLGEAARELLQPIEPDSPLLIVTDREITPPAEWRYIISDEIDNGAVISAAPTDPLYWRERNPHRVAVIKHRVRTAALGIVGSFLELKECDNPGCFMYSDVDSVTTLDAMTQMGPEHDLPKLAGLGFWPIVNEPGLIQPIVADPGPEESRAR
jgi:hypothetical protein